MERRGSGQGNGNPILAANQVVLSFLVVLKTHNYVKRWTVFIEALSFHGRTYVHI